MSQLVRRDRLYCVHYTSPPYIFFHFTGTATELSIFHSTTEFPSPLFCLSGQAGITQGAEGVILSQNMAACNLSWCRSGSTGEDASKSSSPFLLTHISSATETFVSAINQKDNPSIMKSSYSLNNLQNPTALLHHNHALHHSRKLVTFNSESTANYFLFLFFLGAAS